MSNLPSFGLKIVTLLVVLFGAIAGIAAWLGRSDSTKKPDPEPDNPAALLGSNALPPFSESRYLNVGPEVHYIGTTACAACHSSNHESYLKTPHSQALSDLDPKAEPPDGTYQHAASGRTYRVYRKDGQLRHEEVLRTPEGKEVARVDLPIRYLIGSGHYTRSYLVEVDGFLHESPITWYASKRDWDMSPGYDVAQPWGFERPVSLECVACHAGRVEEADGGFHRLKFYEKTIGCESCHGPGSLHQDFHRTKKLARGETDLTIVHPAKLSRSLQESICAACHLNNTSMVPVRGREMHEFRPGRPLSDYRVRYRFSGGEDKMTVVGHVDQLRQSACYQKSDLTCVSCHDPHHSEDVKDKVAFYREKCLSCHTSQPCKLNPNERTKAKDNCVTCHMPSGDTEIPHIAFTHHRIGHHDNKPVKRVEQVSDLVTDDDISHLGPLDQQRNLGLAYQKLSRSSNYVLFAENFQWRALKLLEGASNGGLDDAETMLVIAELNSERDPKRATALARQVLERTVSPTARTRALTLIFDNSFQSSNYPVAIKTLEEMTRLRRNSDDWRFLGLSYLRQNELQKALSAFQTALSIQPFRSTNHEGLAELYRRQGDTKKADECLEKAKWLNLHR